uniref:Uncharacterized protein n=2 Tax=Triticum urartu TaxID=4572 RepID=A0A8R7NW03_TRIUA
MSAKRKPGRSPAAAANATAQAKEDDAGGLFSSRSSAYLGLQALRDIQSNDLLLYSKTGRLSKRYSEDFGEALRVFSPSKTGCLSKIRRLCLGMGFPLISCLEGPIQFIIRNKRELYKQSTLQMPFCSLYKTMTSSQPRSSTAKNSSCQTVFFMYTIILKTAGSTGSCWNPALTHLACHCRWLLI